ncbi:MAG: hypothetical protein QXJ07_05050 [Candidatus Bathyarchaeia archaeon]
MIVEDMIRVVSVVADLGIVISVIVLIYQIALERRELKYNTYDRLMSDFTTISLYIIDHPRFKDMYVGKAEPKNWKKYSEEQKSLYYYFDSLLALFERVWIACKEMKIISKEDWKYWRRWLQELSENQIFKDTFWDNRELYDDSFAKEVESVISASNE